MRQTRVPRTKRIHRVPRTMEQIKHDQQQWAIKRKFDIADHLFKLGHKFDTSE